MKFLRLAHISDPHFASATYSLSQFFSKRWLGNTNLILFRNKLHQTDHLATLPSFLSSLNIEAVALTGDLTTTSLDKEYVQARHFVDSFSVPLFVLPGNHDIYTKESERKRRFYHYFPLDKGKNVEVKQIKPGFWWVGLHTAYASNLFLSSGMFTPSIGKELRNALEAIPKGEKIIIGNHFPLLNSGNPRHDLKGAKQLQNLLKDYPHVILYLHGHDHVPYFFDKRNEGLPLICNSGSISHTPGGGFSLFELSDKECIWQRYTVTHDLSGWLLCEEKNYRL